MKADRRLVVFTVRERRLTPKLSDRSGRGKLEIGNQTTSPRVVRWSALFAAHRLPRSYDAVWQSITGQLLNLVSAAITRQWPRELSGDYKHVDHVTIVVAKHANAHMNPGELDYGEYPAIPFLVGGFKGAPWVLPPNCV